MRYIDARSKPQTTELVVPTPAPVSSVPEKYRGNAAADAQRVIEAAADKVFAGIPEDIATEAARRAMLYPSFSAATAEATFATFRDEVQQERE
jgi:hypothetical protein